MHVGLYKFMFINTTVAFCIRLICLLFRKLTGYAVWMSIYFGLFLQFFKRKYASKPVKKVSTRNSDGEYSTKSP